MAKIKIIAPPGYEAAEILVKKFEKYLNGR